MNEALETAIEQADLRADALDDPIDLENHAIHHWLEHHVSFRHGHGRWVVGTALLPIRWRKHCLNFTFPSDAVHFLQKMSHDHAAMAGIRRAVTAVNGAPMCATDQGYIEMLADLLSSRRAWIINSRERVPIAGRTDPAVYAHLNASLGTNVNFQFLSRWEGGQYLRGYVPFSHGIVAGHSGLTIATGFDVGQRSEKNLADMPLPPEVGPKLAPYAGVRFTGMNHKQVLKIVLKRGPIPTLTKPEADAVDEVVHREYLVSARDSFNARRKPGVPDFDHLPANWQTVLFSRTFHQGTGMPDTAVAKPFYTDLTEGKWSDAVKALRNYNVTPAWYKTRVHEEADYLATELPPPVHPPPKHGPAHPHHHGAPNTP